MIAQKRQGKRVIQPTTTTVANQAIFKAICQIVIEFLEKFLLAPLEPKKANTRGEFIDVGRELSKLPLVNPITLVDEFDTWHFDYLHGLFELNRTLPPFHIDGN